MKHTDAPPDSLEYGRKITDLRKQRGISQKDLALASGVPITAIRRCEQKGQIPLHRYLLITSALGALVKIAAPATKPKKRATTLLPAKSRKLQIRSHMTPAHAMGVARQIAAQLKSQGATRVLLFGSLLTPKFDPDYSDIDIYYEGIPPEKSVRAEVKATWETGEEDETGRRRVDLISEKTRGLEIKQHILATGIPLCP